MRSEEYREAQRQLSEIFKEGDFSRERFFQQRGEEWNRWMEQMDEMIRRLLHGLGWEANPDIGWLLPPLLGLFLLLLWIWVGRRMTIGGKWKEKTITHRTASPAKAVTAWWRRGEEAADQGRYREGIRCLFRAVLEALSHHGEIPQSSHKTNREYIEEVRRCLPDRYSAFSELTAHFERIWYGRMPVNGEEYRRFLERAGPLVRGGDCNETD